MVGTIVAQQGRLFGGRARRLLCAIHEQSIGGARRLHAKFGMSTSMRLGSIIADIPNLAWCRLAPPIDCSSVEISTVGHSAARQSPRRVFISDAASDRADASAEISAVSSATRSVDGVPRSTFDV